MRRIAIPLIACTAAALLAAPAHAGPAPQPGTGLVLSAVDRALLAADRAAESGLDALAKGPHEQLRRVRSITGERGLQYSAYERTYRGLPVLGADAVVTSDPDGRIRDISAAPTRPITVGIVPAVPAAKASEVARGKLATVDSTSVPQLSVLAGDNPRLVWNVHVTGRTATAPSSLHVYVDAQSGAVADAYDDVRHAAAEGSGTGYYNGSVTIQTSGSGSSYTMRDGTRSNLQCGGQNGSAYTGTDDVWGNGQGTNLETACVDVMYAAQQEWDMLKNWIGRNGFNGNGGAFPARVGLSDVNAYWNGSYTNFGRSQDSQRQVTPIDVVAHEYGHAIFQFSGTGQGGSGNETGGLNESTGDIFGALTEHYANNSNDPPDYEVGEEVNLVGRGPIRYMYDPSRVGDPNCYSSSIPNTEVHAAAGPQNHWFYLLAEGSAPGGGKPNSPICSGGPAKVTGIGIQKAGKIFHTALLTKSSTWVHSSVRRATLQAAKDLYAPSCVEWQAVKDAWNAVSVPAVSGEATCTGGPANDFSISLNPASGTVQQGSSVTSTVGTQTTSGNAQMVNLTVSGLPNGVTGTISPASVTSGGSATLTLNASSSAAQGNYTVTVTGTGSVTHTATYSLQVGTGGPGPGAPNIDVAKVQAHLTQFGTIASQNGGNRRAGSAGYTASLNYVKGKLQAAGYQVTEQYCSTCTYPSNNLIADWPGGDTSNTVMFGAHLDGVSAGPGINDNGSGSAVTLEVALALAQANPQLSKHVRFAWWTDEEQGLNGSEYYVGQLSASQRSAIKGYYNFDMVGSRNAGYFINQITSSTAAPLKEYWDSLNIQPEENVEGAGRSDDASFRAVGIPTSGYATGASARKTTAQAGKWGGTANSAYDPCYHASCDTTSNVAATPLDRSADGLAFALWKLAVVSSPSNDFSVSANPAQASTQAGGTASTTVGTQTTSGSPQTVQLTATGLPAGVTVSFNPSSVLTGNSSAATFTTSASTPSGSYDITITATGSVTRTANFRLTVGPVGGGDFSVSVNPGSGTVQAGQSAATTVGTQTTSGNPQTVTLSAAGLPAGATASFNPSSVTTGNSSALTISTSASTPAGTYTVTITAAGSVSRSVSYTLTVTGSPGGCGGLPVWNSGTTYVPGDVVQHNGHKYTSTWYSAGAEPGAPQSWAVWRDEGAC
ncbi:M20/M25/M40 family metallo-hydrolase [Longispora albida]|uniref:M20/M25/M40 family metallo-hydrolase n=1 Tax=Longispora albida TaxID=203523 RepID=UPI0003725DE5|nr:M20/M25/M40 family metallo-hydrolase [Longispora albida]